jgi:hypothetical protein
MLHTNCTPEVQTRSVLDRHDDDGVGVGNDNGAQFGSLILQEGPGYNSQGLVRDLES